jgi:RHS repeat-associated protein
VWSYGYDEFGNLTRVTDPLAGVTQYQYDELGRRTLRELSDGTVERTAYADVPVGGGLKVAQTLVTDWRGATTVTTEDLMGRLWTRELPGMNAGDPDTVETYAYAASGQVAQVVVTTNGATNRITYYAYDGLNRLTNKDCPEGVLGYTWTADNHVQSITAYRRGLVATHGVITNGTPADVSLSYGYDYAGRLSTVTNWFAYNAQNRLTTLTVTNAGKMGRQYSYGLGPTGARTNVLELTQPAGSLQQRWGAAWEYDGRYGTNAVPARAYRLTRETLTNATDWAAAITNVYDAVGNRLTRSVGLAITPVEALTNQSFRYDRRDLIDSDTVANNANTNYDADGNTLVDNGAPTGDRYDAENRLIGRGTTITQVYDMDGNRARKTVSGVTTYYLVDDQNPTGYAQVLAEYANPSNAPAVTYAYGLALVSQTRSGTTSWYGFDGQGNVRFLMNGSGTITDSYDYDAFGRLLAQTGTTSNSCRFAGQQWDSDLGLYYMRARYLKTDLGRFWTSDTLEGSQDEPLGLHRYLYCNGTPINEIDPSGEIYVPSRSDIGNYIHWYIGTDFQSTGSKRFFGTPISRILNVRWIPGLTASQPDLAQQPQGNRSGEVYEIKPSGSYLEGRTQLQYYLRILNHLDPKKRFWDAGTASTYSPPNVIILGPAVLAEVHPPQNGVILYDVVDLRKIVALVAVAAGIDIKIGVAEATLVDTVGAAP